MTKLLVSVRTAAEAEAALAGGADLIDVKEPARGSLGRADDRTIAAVIEAVAERRPVSAALGELLPWPPPFPGTGLAYAKWGLAGFHGREGAWRYELDSMGVALAEIDPQCRLVAVAYADWRRAQAPPPDEVCDFAIRRPAGAFLLDTWGKDGTTLLDCLSLPEICRLSRRCREAGVPVALAGSLGPEQIEALRSAQPNWIAVRGAVCQGRQRRAAIDEGKVRQLAELLQE